MNRLRHLIPTAFGLLMVVIAVGQAVIQGDGRVIVLALSTIAVVLAAIRFRSLATLAVLLTVALIVLAGGPPMFAALAGLVATGYLVLRHAVDAGMATATPQTMIAAAGFTAVVVTAMVLPVGLPWLPLAAPLAVLAGFAIAIGPFWVSGADEPSSRSEPAVSAPDTTRRSD